jgi:hypothetical protein
MHELYYVQRARLSELVNKQRTTSGDKSVAHEEQIVAFHPPPVRKMS